MAALNYNSEENAKEVARKMLRDEARSQSTQALYDSIGWPKRHFNPAAAYILPPFDQVNDEVQAEFPTGPSEVNDGARVRLKQFIADGFHPRL